MRPNEENSDFVFVCLLTTIRLIVLLKADDGDEAELMQGDC